MNWTEGRVKSFITSVLRGGWLKWPSRYEALNKAKTEVRINEKTGRRAVHYLCNGCKKEFPSKDVCVDHKKPVVDIKRGFVSWDEYISRLYCETSNLQVLCRLCHDVKTKKEKEAKKKHAKNNT